METTDILVKVKLSPKVLEGLDKEETYTCLRVYSGKVIMTGGFLSKNIDIALRDFTHIYLPLTVTNEMVEKEANKKFPVKHMENTQGQLIDVNASQRKHFIEGYVSALS